MTIDILLPYYGRVDHMQLSVQSVLAQTDGDWRLTVIDDGFPDDSIPGWFTSLGDDRVRYLRNEQNLGANANYRKSLEFVTAPWFVMMGADDVMLPDYLARVKELIAQSPTAGFVHPGVQTIEENGELAGGMIERGKAIYRPRGSGIRRVAGEPLAVGLARGNWMYFPAICWNAEAVLPIGFRPGLNVVQDLALAFDVIKTGREVVVDDQVVFQYRRHAASDSSWRALEGTRFIEEGDFLRGMAAEFLAMGWPRAARAARRHFSSRVNAALLIPKAVKAGNTAGVRNLRRHALGRARA
ncbi:MAG: glycosyltransferase family 2 protein [Cryobacterium sp.]|nr:glycosyltransferase family 2 protein [Cryobacterium sp.]